MMQKEKQLVPKLRFKEFKEEWQEKIYNQIYSFYSTNSFSRDNLNYEEGKVKNIHYGDIHTKFSTLFDITKESVPFINSDINISKIKEENYCKEGDLLIADASEDYNDIGKTIEIINLNNERLVSGLHTFLARPNKFKMAIGFSGYMLQNWNARKQIMTIAQGTKVLGLATSRLGKINLIIPSIEEQQKIANFLTAIDRRIQSLEKKKSLLEAYKKGVMQKLLNQEIRFKDENGDVFPKWEKKKLGNFLIEVNEKTKISSQHTILSSTARGLFNQSDYFTRDIASKDNTGYKILRKHQLVFSPQNLWLGNINVNCDFEVGIVSPSYKVFDFNKKLTSFNFCKYLLFTNRMFYEYSQASEQGASVVRRNLDMASFKAIPIKLPCLEEQSKIANFISAIDKKINLVGEQIKKTKTYKKGLLQQMFV